jgi:hypothetical protein
MDAIGWWKWDNVIITSVAAARLKRSTAPASRLKLTTYRLLGEKRDGPNETRPSKTSKSRKLWRNRVIPWITVFAFKSVGSSRRQHYQPVLTVPELILTKSSCPVKFETHGLISMSIWHNEEAGYYQIRHTFLVTADFWWLCTLFAPTNVGRRDYASCIASCFLCMGIVTLWCSSDREESTKHDTQTILSLVICDG